MTTSVIAAFATAAMVLGTAATLPATAAPAAGSSGPEAAADAELATGHAAGQRERDPEILRVRALLWRDHRRNPRLAVHVLTRYSVRPAGQARVLDRHAGVTRVRVRLPEGKPLTAKSAWRHSSEQGRWVKVRHVVTFGFRQTRRLLLATRNRPAMAPCGERGCRPAEVEAQVRHLRNGTRSGRDRAVQRWVPRLMTTDDSPSCPLAKGDYSGQTIQDLRLTGCDLSDSQFDRATFIRVDMMRVKLSDASLTQASMTGLNAEYGDFRRADLSGVSWVGGTAHFASFVDANLVGANLAGSSFSHADFTRALLLNADLRGTHLKWADLTDADFRNARFPADVWNAVFKHTTCPNGTVTNTGCPAWPNR